jgi:hypothetical protein
MSASVTRTFGDDHHDAAAMFYADFLFVFPPRLAADTRSPARRQYARALPDELRLSADRPLMIIEEKILSPL